MYIKKSTTIDILQYIQQTGRFLVKKGKVWNVVPDGVARQKIAHSIQYHQRRSLKDASWDDETSATNVLAKSYKLREKITETNTERIQSGRTFYSITEGHQHGSNDLQKLGLASDIIQAFDDISEQTDSWNFKMTKNQRDISADPMASELYNVGPCCQCDQTNSANHKSTDRIFHDAKMSSAKPSFCQESLNLVDTYCSTQDHATAFELNTTTEFPQQPSVVPLFEDRFPTRVPVDSDGYPHMSLFTLHLDNKINDDGEDLSHSSLYRSSSGFSYDSCLLGWTGLPPNHHLDDDAFII